jgi:GTP-binding protein EngB required for normal cell division
MDTSVLGLLDDCLDLAGSTGDQALRERLTEERTRLLGSSAGRPVVVVVGATKAGKSALINALLRRPGLSPVDDLVATNAYIEFLQAPETYASVHRDDEVDATSIDVHLVADWVTEQGNPENQRRVRSVEIGLDAPILHDITLIDTPGTGGVKAAHLALTLIALGFADALVFVVDGQRELTESALGFLKDASQRTETIILAVTKKDKYHHTDEVLEVNKRLLNTHAPRFAQAPMIAVSSRLAVQALEAREPLASALREESGVDELEAALHEHVVSRADQLGHANAVRHALSFIDAIERRLSELEVAAESVPGFRDTAASEMERLTVERTEATAWREKLERELGSLRTDELDRFGVAMAKLIGEYGRRARSVSDADAQNLFSELDEDITTASADLFRATNRRTPEVVGPILQQIDAGSLLEASAARLVGQLPEITIHPPAPAKADEKFAFTKLLSRSPGIASQLNFMGAQAHIAVGMPPLAIATLLVGGAFAVLKYQRNQQARRDRFEDAVADETRRAERLIGDAYRSHIEDLVSELSSYVDRFVARRQEEVERLIRENELAVQRSATEQEERRRGLQRDIARARELRNEAVSLLRHPAPA